MNLLTTFKGSMMEGFLPAGWDLAKIDRVGGLAGAARALLPTTDGVSADIQIGGEKGLAGLQRACPPVRARHPWRSLGPSAAL